MREHGRGGAPYRLERRNNLSPAMQPLAVHHGSINVDYVTPRFRFYVDVPALERGRIDRTSGSAARVLILGSRSTSSKVRYERPRRLSHIHLGRPRRHIPAAGRAVKVAMPSPRPGLQAFPHRSRWHPYRVLQSSRLIGGQPGNGLTMSRRAIRASTAPRGVAVLAVPSCHNYITGALWGYLASMCSSC